MGRTPCCDKKGLKKGQWTPEEDDKLIRYIQLHGPGNWRTLPKNAGLQRCGKSCRLRWTNYLRPDIKRGRFSFEEEEAIIQLHSILGNKWSAIAARLPGRTDNEIKNFWNTHIRKRLLRMGIDPVTHSPRLDLLEHLSSAIGTSSQLNLQNLLGLQAILSPELLALLGNIISSQNPQLYNTQFQNPPSVPTIPDRTHQTQMNFDQYNLSSQPSPDNNSGLSSFDCDPNSIPQHNFDQMGTNNQGEYSNLDLEQLMNSRNDPNLSFESTSSTPLSSSSDSSNLMKFEIPAGCLDINDFL